MTAAAAVVALLLIPSPVVAQASPAARGGPVVGDVAPEFEIVGATRYGVLRDPVRLADFRGKTAVIAFFYQARSRG